MIAEDFEDQRVAKNNLVVMYCDSDIRNMFKQCHRTKIWENAFTEEH